MILGDLKKNDKFTYLDEPYLLIGNYDNNLQLECLNLKTNEVKFLWLRTEVLPFKETEMLLEDLKINDCFTFQEKNFKVLSTIKYNKNDNNRPYIECLNLNTNKTTTIHPNNTVKEFNPSMTYNDLHPNDLQ